MDSEEECAELERDLALLQAVHVRFMTEATMQQSRVDLMHARARLTFGAAWDAFVRRFNEQFPAVHARAPDRSGWHETYADHGCGDCGMRARCQRVQDDPSVVVCSRWEG